jgi:hypothetical protein
MGCFAEWPVPQPFAAEVLGGVSESNTYLNDVWSTAEALLISWAQLLHPRLQLSSGSVAQVVPYNNQ